MVKYADVIVDLQAGDTGKGKVAHSLAKIPSEYNYVVRYNGGGNAGHTVYHDGEKVVTHFVPVGVLYNIYSIIGPGCVVDPVKLEKELDDLSKVNPNVRDYLMIDSRVHVITEDHKEEDGKDTRIGTTRTGNGPAYRDKYARVGNRSELCTDLQRYVCDVYELFHKSKMDVKILFEGAQGFELDVDWGDYPYVTSSHCTVGSAILNGVPPQKIRKVYGVSKAYRTYVGAKPFEKGDSIFSRIREVGQEYGATTGRPRQISFLNLDDLVKAANINGVTDLIINKLDVLEELNNFVLVYESQYMEFETSGMYTYYIENVMRSSVPSIQSIVFSKSPNHI